MIRLIVISDVDTFLRRTRHAAGSETELIALDPAEFSAAHVLQQLGTARRSQIVIFGPGTPVVEALSMSEVIDRDYPMNGVILAVNLDPDQWLTAMRAGVRDVLAPNAEVADIRIALGRAASALQRSAAPQPGTESVVRRGRIIPVASPKGGSGKTTVATNLAVGLARLAPQQTVIVDLDLQFGDVATALQLVPENGLLQAVQAADPRDAMVLKTFLTPHRTGVYALCAPDSPAAGEAIAGDDVAQLLDVLAKEFRYVVVDTAPGLTEQTLAVLDQASDLVMVCGMDVPSIRGTRKELGVLAELALDQMDKHLVVNFADRRSGLSVKEVEQVLGVTVDIVLPRSRAVPLSTNQGVPLLQSRTRDGATRGLEQLVKRFQPDLRAPTARGARHRAVSR